VSEFDACVVGTGADLGNSVLLTAILRDLGAKFIAAKAVTDRQAHILRKVGADLIVFPEKEMGQRLAHQLLSPGRILEHLQFDPEWSIEEIEAPAWMIGKTLRELDLRRRHGVTVIAFRRKGQILPNPAGDDAIQKGDWLVVFGRNADLERMVTG
jgi:trk system potassium uptake protein TrkA